MNKKDLINKEFKNNYDYVMDSVILSVKNDYKCYLILNSENILSLSDIRYLKNFIIKTFQDTMKELIDFKYSITTLNNSINFNELNKDIINSLNFKNLENEKKLKNKMIKY